MTKMDWNFNGETNEWISRVRGISHGVANNDDTPSDMVFSYRYNYRTGYFDWRIEDASAIYAVGSRPTATEIRESFVELLNMSLGIVVLTDIEEVVFGKDI